MLKLTDADVCYDQSQALFGVSLEIREGEVVALVGRNGAGKSTLLKALCGWLPLRSGTLMLDGQLVTDLTPERASRSGVAYVPDNRQVFPTLTVQENLQIAQTAHPKGKYSLEQAFELFPQLAHRRTAFGGGLSGGEQQMLAIARALMCSPRLLLLDEPTEGLAPVIVDTLIHGMRNVIADGISILLVEQNMRVPSQLAQRCVVLDSGRQVWGGTIDEFHREESQLNRLLSL